MKDDDVQITSNAPNARLGDRLEVWWDRGGDPWSEGDWAPKLAPVPQTTSGVLLLPLPEGQVRVSSLFPSGAKPPAIKASWKRTPAGYSVEFEIDRSVLESTEKITRETTVDLDEEVANFTIAIRDVDANTEPGMETGLATSTFEPPGAPFGLGWLHLPKRQPAKATPHAPAAPAPAAIPPKP